MQYTYPIWVADLGMLSEVFTHANNLKTRMIRLLTYTGLIQSLWIHMPYGRSLNVLTPTSFEWDPPANRSV